MATQEEVAVVFCKGLREAWRQGRWTLSCLVNGADSSLTAASILKERLTQWQTAPASQGYTLAKC